MERPLSGNVAFVTGSGRGLGRAIAERLAEMGADVAVHDISQEAPAEFGEAAHLNAVAASLGEFDVRTFAVTGDIADELTVRAMARRVEEALGLITILVNCAGGDIAAQGGKPNPNDALGIKMEDVRALIDRNLVGTILACQAIVPAMRERKKGSVINIASGAAHLGVTDGVIYAVAKAGIVHYTRCLAAELRPHGVRVNCVSPGPTKTARFLVTRKIDPALMDEENPSLVRYGSPREIADAVAFFAGDGAKFITGQVLRVDGGRTLFAG